MVIAFIVYLNDCDEPYGIDIKEGVIKVRKNKTYDEVEEILNREPHDDETMLFHALNRIGEKNGKKRLEMGAILIKKEEVIPLVDERGAVTLKRINPMTKARRMVEELMLICGEWTAKYLQSRNIPAIYRKQSFGDSLHTVKNRVISDILEFYQLIVSLKKAELSVNPERHHSLGLECYVQVTSPLRRFQDLILHYQLKHFLMRKEPYFTDQDLFAIFKDLEDTATLFGYIQQQAKVYWILEYIREVPIRAVNGIIIKHEGPYTRLYLSDFCIEESHVFHTAKPDIGSVVTLSVKKVDLWNRRLLLEER